VVQGAIVSTQHSFFLQGYDSWGTTGTTGSAAPRNMGTLNFTGAMAQSFRGPLNRDYTQGVSGYAKNFVYDPRMAYAPPPYLADLTETSWGVRYFAEGVG
jgi:hypothetical protein